MSPIFPESVIGGGQVNQPDLEYLRQMWRTFKTQVFFCNLSLPAQTQPASARFTLLWYLFNISI